MVVLPALTGDSSARLVGEGHHRPRAPIDTDHWCALAANVLGGPPAQFPTMARDGKPWSSRFADHGARPGGADVAAHRWASPGVRSSAGRYGRTPALDGWSAAEQVQAAGAGRRCTSHRRPDPGLRHQIAAITTPVELAGRVTTAPAAPRRRPAAGAPVRHLTYHAVRPSGHPLRQLELVMRIVRRALRRRATWNTRAPSWSSLRRRQLYVTLTQDAVFGGTTCRRGRGRRVVAALRSCRCRPWWAGSDRTTAASSAWGWPGLTRLSARRSWSRSTATTASTVIRPRRSDNKDAAQ